MDTDYSIDITFSQKQKFLEASVLLDTIISKNYEMGSFILDFEKNICIVHTIQEDCQLLLLPTQSYINDENQLDIQYNIDINNLWILFAYYDGIQQFDKPYHKFDINTLLQLLGVNDIQIFLYFTKNNKDLSFVQVFRKNQKKPYTLYVQEPLTEIDFEQIDKQPPSHWKCSKNGKIIDYQNSTYQDMFIDGIDFIEDNQILENSQYLDQFIGKNDKKNIQQGFGNIQDIIKQNK
ncbi:hypothetical protein PPERSA_03312 [Pseudocohnilembus persalinus]|uniref:Uncharacterized protein n=1 Tax=Pseudocohnilembus persalinus TaxID=266149 RepID=A0A0V0Q8H8_PSEPJ|nr:hypothetical protein PPERSA_03312 [Pseudocohnilembus persalinus]|eukprot:KRW98481.1 hypothetical protein PPERSA_03312 [Pseudocohnilembus persalinus]